ncbi:copper resistance system multicopper oxidase [Henriciella marina]|uniref:copper resistance system multicopper oxidase n=1 Tax=Henriciella marina TaxID=453851 RepID=UPI00036C968C|nr:copper resistance system multicopper oxidase [Henriciella marina]
MFNRRSFLGVALGSGAAIGSASLLPAWARSAAHGNTGITTLTGNKFDLDIGEFAVNIGGKMGHAVGVNKTLPAPLIRFREGEEVTLNVTNRLKADTSIHWHGLLVPFHMDGVPGVSFPGIKPGETFQYKFAVPQSGSYWYHSHSGLQEQQGHYGPLVIDPAGPDPVVSDREYVMVLSDWSFEHPHRIFEKLKASAETYNFNQRTVGDFVEDAGEEGFGEALSDRTMWGSMRMSPRDIADVTGATYTYLINGHSTYDNWNGVFEPGERVRLRVINASAMSIFNVRLPGLPMTVVAADGLNVRPVETDEFQIGVAETYDVIIEPQDARAYAFVAESIDRSGQAVATFGPRAGMRAEAPALRAVPTLTMKDMAMDHGSHVGHSMAGMEAGQGDADSMPHDGHDVSAMDHSNHASMSGMDHSGHDMSGMSHEGQSVSGQDHDMSATDGGMQTHNHPDGPGVAAMAMMPVSRLDEPGIGLEDVDHRVLTYADLRALEPNTDTRPPERELQIHLTSNMHRYMWSFNGVKFSEVTESIRLNEGERVRFMLVNDTMMPHPIHLHGMFFELENGAGSHRPRKHTVIVKPGEKVGFDVSSEHLGDWAFHCHLLFHMHAGMMNVVSVIPEAGGAAAALAESHQGHEGHDGMDHGDTKQSGMDHGNMDHGAMNHEGMDHGSMKQEGQSGMSHEGHDMGQHKDHGGHQ